MENTKVSESRHENYERPPWWVKLPLYLAVYGQEHFVDYRLSLQRRYLAKQRDMSLAAARRLAQKEAVTYWFAAGERVFWAFTRLVPHVMKWLIGGAS